MRTAIDSWRFDYPKNFLKLQQFAISPDDFTFLDSTKFQILEDTVKKQKGEQIVDLVRKIGVENLSRLFRTALEDIFASNGSDKRRYIENKHTISCLFRAANFI